jgi:hypothetical protein
MKSRRMRLAEHVARIGREELCIRFWWEIDHWGDPGVDERII